MKRNILIAILVIVLIVAIIIAYFVIQNNMSNNEVGQTERRGFIIDNVLHSEEQGLRDDEINNILVLDVKEHEYFTSQGMTDEHAGLGLFAYDENVMNWVFSKTK